MLSKKTIDTANLSYFQVFELESTMASNDLSYSFPFT